MDYTRQQIAQACRYYGAHVAPLPTGVDGSSLLWAISGNESSFGANCTPRHEPAYDVGGFLYSANTIGGQRVRDLVTQFGSAAACSYGPWQIMFANCPPNYTPLDMDDLDKAAIATVSFLNKQLTYFRPTGLMTIAAIWNGGNPGALERPVVATYAKHLESNYRIPILEQT